MKKIGTAGMDLVETRSTYSARSGPIIEETWEGLSTEIAAQVDAAVPADMYGVDSFSIEDGPTAKKRLTIRYSADPGTDPEAEVPVDEFRLEANRVVKGIWEHPILDEVTEEEIRMLRDHIQNPQEGVTPALTTPEAIDLYLLALKGVEGFTIYQPVLYRTFTASFGFNFAPDYSLVGKVILDADIATVAQLAAFGTISLPSAGAPRAGYTWGWLMHYPTLSVAAANKQVYAMEFEFGLWADLLYSTYEPPA